MDEIVDPHVPPGAAKTDGPMGFDPFDQELAKKELLGARERLADLHARMRDVAPDYAAQHLEPKAMESEFFATLASHQSSGSHSG